MDRTTHIVAVITSIILVTTCVTALEHHNVTDASKFREIFNRHGDTVLIEEDLMKRLDEELATWHWKPWLRTLTQEQDGVLQKVDCPTEASVESFPDSIFTDEQLRQGAFLCYLMFGIYAFTLLAIVCNDYFLPCVELICEDLKIPQNVAAATFMSVATSCPEFFVNVFSTFLTQGDMGIGTIVGSAIFNCLGVAAIGGLAAVKAISIEAGPVTRDVLIYMVNVSILVVIVWDGQVDWQEATVLGVMYILYFVFMFNSVRLFNLFDKLITSCCRKKNHLQVTELANDKSIEEGVDNRAFTESTTNIIAESNGIGEKSAIVLNDDGPEKPKKSLFRFPREKSLMYRLWWLYTWPLKAIMTVTIPSPVTCRKFYPLSFMMCILWIGVNSFFVSWSMTVIGHTFTIPDSVMGMTFLAFGGCLPEAVSIFILSRRGEGGIGVSNALGANSLAILFALGVPWLIKTLTLVAQGAEQQAVLINSAGIDFVVGSLLVAVACLWLTLFIGKFKLRKSVGAVLVVLYVIFITFAILVEMGVILSTDARCML
ncbi:unnamed protein product [Diatraea saccharalis]|uniref:Sodium/calcium exchanger membrane region domain-containing protein n=1 Tax=Diatraea saccharalis TaxID=40085 RepID=A0A9N9N371_9NEOP|nr:unnamed protein product [Diatraea saccharalis]